jgi:DNA polymerase V
MIALVDCNNFYVSCERLFRPDLDNKPVCVLSSNDGCVIARSQEIKDLGIHVGAPAYKYKSLFEKHKVTLFSTNFPLYGDISSRVMSVLSDYSDNMEVYSIDEAFLHIDLYKINYLDYGNEIRERLLKWVGIPTCVGIAETKTLAKLANRIAKKYPQLNGVHIIDSDEKREKALKWAKIEDIWGIGNKSAEKMRSYGIINAYDFVARSDYFIRKNLTVVGLRIKRELLGSSCLDVDNQPVSKKSILTSRSFSRPVKDFDAMMEALASHTFSCALKLRKQSSCAQTIMVFLHTSKHRKDKPQYSNYRSMHLDVATNSTNELIVYARSLLEMIFKEGYDYNKVGVMLTNIIPQTNIQGNLFDNVDRAKNKKLMKAMDKINSIHGIGNVHMASQSVNKYKISKQERLSPQYTTRWTDILCIGKKDL